MEIMLARFRIPLQELKAAILNVDERILSLEKVLVKNWIQFELMTEILSYLEIRNNTFYQSRIFRGLKVE